TPTIAYAGDSNFSIDDLNFSTSSYNHPTRVNFAAMEWRVGEISNPGTPGFDPNAPWIYEIDPVWESGELPAYGSEVQVPGTALIPGHTYRARVRMQDEVGAWSRWSEPIEFVAAAGTAPSVAITEIHYHPNNPELLDEDDQEFVELLNTGATTVDLSGFQLVDFASTAYVIANGTTLDPGEYLVIARDPMVFETVYGSGINVLPTGYATANLSNGGETITLLTSSGTEVFSVAYDDVAPWPTEPDGAGPSLEIIDPYGDPNDPANWRASALDGGSPGSSGEGGVTLPGDYNEDLVVDSADLAVWETQLGTTVDPVGSGADGDGDGRVAGGDFLLWQRSFGATAPATLASTSSTTIATLALRVDESTDAVSSNAELRDLALSVEMAEGNASERTAASERPIPVASSGEERSRTWTRRGDLSTASNEQSRNADPLGTRQEAPAATYAWDDGLMEFLDRPLRPIRRTRA
ncbi:MAG: lamin tail domain-containing protein, partial [Planctomycetales bacterium]|nr:lamin tail domain-containing protein [Planctomycetales bacterium]